MNKSNILSKLDIKDLDYVYVVHDSGSTYIDQIISVKNRTANQIFGFSITNQRIFSLVVGILFAFTYTQVLKLFLRSTKEVIYFKFIIISLTLLFLDDSFQKATIISRPEIVVLLLGFFMLMIGIAGALAVSRLGVVESAIRRYNPLGRTRVSSRRARPATAPLCRKSLGCPWSSSSPSASACCG